MKSLNSPIQPQFYACFYFFKFGDKDETFLLFHLSNPISSQKGPAISTGQGISTRYIVVTTTTILIYHYLDYLLDQPLSFTYS